MPPDFNAAAIRAIRARLEAFTQVVSAAVAPGVAQLAARRLPAEDVLTVFSSVVTLHPNWASGLFLPQEQAQLQALSHAKPEGWRSVRRGQEWYSPAGAEVNIGPLAARWPGRYWDFVLVDARGAEGEHLREALAENIALRLRPTSRLVILAEQASPEWNLVQGLFSASKGYRCLT